MIWECPAATLAVVALPQLLASLIVQTEADPQMVADRRASRTAKRPDYTDRCELLLVGPDIVQATCSVVSRPTFPNQCWHGWRSTRRRKQALSPPQNPTHIPRVHSA